MRRIWLATSASPSRAAMPASLQRLVRSDDPLRRILVGERRGRHEHVGQLGSPVVVRRAAQRPGQRDIGIALQLRRAAHRHAAVGQRPARAVPAGVLNAEVEDRRIGDRPLRLGAIELLSEDPVAHHVGPLHLGNTGTWFRHSAWPTSRPCRRSGSDRSPSRSRRPVSTSCGSGRTASRRAPSPRPRQRWPGPSRLTVGIGLMPAPLRNVAVCAMEVAMLARMFPGRLIAGVGHGVQDWMGQVGARVASPLTLLEEYAGALRRLLGGERVSVAGRYVTLDGVALDWPPDTVATADAGWRGPEVDQAGRAAGRRQPAHQRPDRRRVAVNGRVGRPASAAPVTRSSPPRSPPPERAQPNGSPPRSRAGEGRPTSASASPGMPRPSPTPSGGWPSWAPPRSRSSRPRMSRISTTSSDSSGPRSNRSFIADRSRAGLRLANPTPTNFFFSNSSQHC